MKRFAKFLICVLMLSNIELNVWAMSDNGYIIDYAEGDINKGKIKTYDELFNFKISNGDANAPIKIIKYTTLQCSYCKDLFLSTYEYFQEECEKGNLYVELKFVDYPRFTFDDYIFERYNDIENFKNIYKIYSTYDIWMNFQSFEELDEFFQLGDVKLERVIHEKISMAEFKAKNLNGVPTTIINGDILGEEIDTLEEIKEIIKNYNAEEVNNH